MILKCLKFYSNNLQVSTEGYLSFGRAVRCCPSLTSDTADSDYIVSPFKADINIANGQGNVSYEVHDISTSPGLLSRVSSFIRQQELNNFSGTWMLVAEWSDVPLSGQENSMVWLLHVCVFACARTYVGAHTYIIMIVYLCTRG